MATARITPPARGKSATRRSSSTASDSTNTRPRTKANTSKRAVSWTAEEYEPRGTVWWLIGLLLIGGWLVAVALLLDAWSVAAVITAAVLALMVVRLRKPWNLRYQITGTTLTIARVGGTPAQTRTLDLGAYRGFTTETDPKRPYGGGTAHYLVLLPRTKLRMVTELYAPTTANELSRATTALAARGLPHLDDDPYLPRLRLLRRVARGMRLV